MERLRRIEQALKWKPREEARMNGLHLIDFVISQLVQQYLYLMYGIQVFLIIPNYSLSCKSVPAGATLAPACPGDSGHAIQSR